MWKNRTKLLWSIFLRLVEIHSELSVQQKHCCFRRQIQYTYTVKLKVFV